MKAPHVRYLCLQKGDPAITKAEKLLGYMQMFKPLTRRIKVHALEAFQLPIAQVSMFKKCLCQGKSPSVQSRIVGEYIEEVSGCDCNSKRAPGVCAARLAALQAPELRSTHSVSRRHAVGNT